MASSGLRPQTKTGSLPAFSGSLDAPWLCFRPPVRAVPCPAGTGSSSIRRTMLPDSRRHRFPNRMAPMETGSVDAMPGSVTQPPGDRAVFSAPGL